VIATGIGETRQERARTEPARAAAEAVPVPAMTAADLERPAFRRTEGRSRDSEPVKRVIRSFIDDDLETPTFLRKQMD
jgi:hypothetical protein